MRRRCARRNSPLPCWRKPIRTAAGRQRQEPAASLSPSSPESFTHRGDEPSLHHRCRSRSPLVNGAAGPARLHTASFRKNTEKRSGAAAGSPCRRHRKIQSTKRVTEESNMDKELHHSGSRSAGRRPARRSRRDGGAAARRHGREQAQEGRGRGRREQGPAAGRKGARRTARRRAAANDEKLTRSLCQGQKEGQARFRRDDRGPGRASTWTTTRCEQRLRLARALSASSYGSGGRHRAGRSDDMEPPMEEIAEIEEEELVDPNDPGGQLLHRRSGAHVPQGDRQGALCSPPTRRSRWPRP